MIKNKLAKLILTTSVLALPLLGASTEYTYDSFSLVGIEGGYNYIDAAIATTTPATYRQDNKSLGHLGLKIGAETENYRVFLSGRYYKGQDNAFDYIATYGGEIQYLFNMFNGANFFIGANGGVANMKFVIQGEPFARTISSPYVGGDMGFNIHAGDGVDFELGGKYMSLNSVNDKSGTSYQFNSVLSAYASIIFKYHMK